MAFPVPAIQYDPGTGPVTLIFTFPPIQKPGLFDGSADPLTAERADSITSSGIKQSITERIDQFRDLQMSWVPMVGDMANWSAFMRHALTGAAFSFFPDQNDTGTFDDWTLEDTTWPPKYSVRGHAQFTLKMRKVVGASGTTVPHTIAGGGGGGGGTNPITLQVGIPHPAEPDFPIAHGLGRIPSAAIPVPTSDGLLYLQNPGYDATNVYLTSSDPSVTGVVFVW